MTMATTAPQDIARQDAASFEVYRRLRNDIVTCKFKPHDKLRFDGLRSAYGAGVGTLREALSHLVSDGLVRTEAGRGFFVAPMSATDLLDITEWRVEFETRATALSIENGDDNWEADIVSAFHLMARAGQLGPEASAEALSDFGEKHRRFHDALVAACGSPWLLYFRSVLFDQALRYQALAVLSKGGENHRTDEDHRAIMDAALNRDAKTAQRLVEEHIRGTTETVLKNLPKYDQEEAPRSKAAQRLRRNLVGV
jgi:GntR family carbon starvation induced transcriptional regulator